MAAMSPAGYLILSSLSAAPFLPPTPSLSLSGTVIPSTSFPPLLSLQRQRRILLVHHHHHDSGRIKGRIKAPSLSCKKNSAIEEEPELKAEITEGAAEEGSNEEVSSFQTIPILTQEKKAQSERAERVQEGLSRRTLIWRAIKLPIYSVALVPLSVGSAVAYWQSRSFHIGRFCLLLASSVLVIAWLNLSNDAYDAETGVDKDKQESVVNMTGSREGVLVGAYTCLGIGIAGLVWGAWQAQNMQVAAFLAAAICCGYIYQCPPFRFSYQGLGEPLCFLAFGPFATTAFYLSQSSIGNSLPVTSTILVAAIAVGITTTLILFCSHFHQIEGDRLVGKLSPLVRLGTHKGKDVVKFTVIGLYLLLSAFTATKVLPFLCMLFWALTLPIGVLVVNFVNVNHENKEKIFLAKYYCVRLHAALGAALTLGFATA